MTRFETDFFPSLQSHKNSATVLFVVRSRDVFTQFFLLFDEPLSFCLAHRVMITAN